MKRKSKWSNLPEMSAANVPPTYAKKLTPDEAKAAIARTEVAQYFRPEALIGYVQRAKKGKSVTPKELSRAATLFWKLEALYRDAGTEVAQYFRPEALVGYVQRVKKGKQRKSATTLLWTLEALYRDVPLPPGLTTDRIREELHELHEQWAKEDAPEREVKRRKQLEAAREEARLANLARGERTRKTGKKRGGKSISDRHKRRIRPKQRKTLSLKKKKR